MMSQPLQLSLLEMPELTALTPFAGDFPARIFPILASAKDLKAIAHPCSLKSSDSFARFVLGSSSLKTSQLCLDGEWSAYSGSLPKWGTMRNGLLFHAPTWVDAIAGKGSGLLPILPTPTANDNDNRRTKPTPAELEGRHGWALRSAIAGIELGTYPKLLPTPVANDDNKSPAAHMAMKKRMKGGERKCITSLQVLAKAIAADQLPEAQKHFAKMLPTPKAVDGEHPGVQAHAPGQTLHLSAAVMLPTPITGDWKGGSAAQVDKKRGEQLRDQVDYLSLPTPQARDWKGNSGAGHQERGGNRNLPTTLNTGRKLSPTFVESMMGFPVGWTDLAILGIGEPLLLSPYEVTDEICNATDTEKTPHRKERLKALGNAVVPHAAAIALLKAKEILERQTC
jgi:hypothetical protein